MQIHFAASRGDHDAVRSQLDRGVPVDARFKPNEMDLRYDVFGEAGETALMWAAESPHADISMLELLIGHGADVNAVSDKLEHAPLFEAVKCGQLSKVQLLLDRGADAKFVSKSGTGVLVRYPPPEPAILKVLLAAGAEPHVSSFGESIIKIASGCADWATIKMLSEREVDLDSLRWTPFMRAIALGSIEDVENELPFGNLEDRDDWLRTPWLLAVCTGEMEKVKLLLAAGADLKDTGHYGRTCFEYALLGRNAEVVRFLAEQGADVNASNDFNRTALMFAAESDSLEMVETLLDVGADVDAMDRIEMKAISFARSAAVVRVLVEAGSDINYAGGHEWVLKRAAPDGSPDFIRQLIEMGAIVDKTLSGDTALLDAVRSDNLKVVEVLLKAGADVNAQTCDGCGPLWYVRSAEAARLLLRHGADCDLLDSDERKAYQYCEDEEIRHLIRPRWGP